MIYNQVDGETQSDMCSVKFSGGIDQAYGYATLDLCTSEPYSYANYWCPPGGTKRFGFRFDWA